jgi:hypothetical protein
MAEQLQDRTDLFLRFNRRATFALLAIVLILGSTSLAIMLSPKPVWRSVASGALVPVALVFIATIYMAIRKRSWSPDAPEVKLAMEDEWRRANFDRASRIALTVALGAQVPFAWAIGFLTPLSYTPPRVAMAMAASTITLGVATVLVLFLLFDRE